MTILKISKCFNEIFKCLLLTKSLYTSWACFRNENASAVLTDTTGEGEKEIYSINNLYTTWVGFGIFYYLNFYLITRLLCIFLCAILRTVQISTRAIFDSVQLQYCGQSCGKHCVAIIALKNAIFERFDPNPCGL